MPNNIYSARTDLCAFADMNVQIERLHPGDMEAPERKSLKQILFSTPRMSLKQT